MSVDTIWCFDLAFLRSFVETGKLQRPDEETHAIVYDRCCLSLVTQHDVLKAAARKHIRTLQVSEGYRANIGRLYVEVLYPWEGFYHKLSEPRLLRALLAKKWPPEWHPWAFGAGDKGVDKAAQTRARTVSEEQEILGAILAKYRPDEDNLPHGSLVEGEIESTEEGTDFEGETFPVSLLGTLYNNLSIVVKVHVLGGVHPPQMLFPGDLTDWTYLIAARFQDLSADVFKYPHHGSAAAGVSFPVVEKYGLPYLRPCPCGPWCDETCERWHREFWEGVEVILNERKPRSKQGSHIFPQIVRPAHTLVFPYPSKDLPKLEVLAGQLGQIHANRAHQEPALLASSKNDPAPCVLEVRREHDEIRVI